MKHLIFKDINVISGKTFQTDFRSVVKDNANITNELKDHIVTQFQEAHA